MSVITAPDENDRARAAEEAAKRDARNTPALIAEAEALLKAGRKDLAISLAETALSIMPDSFRIQRGASSILASAGRPVAALNAARTAIALRPDDLGARLHLGSLLLRVGQPANAVEEINVYLAHPDAKAVGWSQLATGLLRLGRHEEAIAAAQEAVAREPQSLERLLSLASVLDSAGRLGDALQVIETAALNMPETARMRRMKSGLHEALGELDQAISEAERAQTLDPNDEAISAHLERLKQMREPSQLPRFSTSKPRVRSIKQQPDPSLARNLAATGRVVAALMLHDMRTRFGRSRIGYLWAVLEPIGHLLTLGIVFSFLNKSPPPVGPNLFLYYLTGLIPFLMFSHIAHEVMHARHAAGALMQLPPVRSFEVLVARAGLQWTTEIIVMIIIFGCASLIISFSAPASLIEIILSIILLAFFGIGIGLINCCMFEIAHWWENFFSAVVRLLYFGSGIYYSPMAMPNSIREYLVWNPVLQGVEYFRAGFFGRYDPHWLAEIYLAKCALISVAAGLAFHALMQKRLRRPV